MKTAFRSVLAIVLVLILCTTSFATHDDGVPDEEPSETIQAINLNEPVQCSLTSEEDTIYYSFTLPANGYIQVEFNHTLSQNHSQNWNIDLYDYFFYGPWNLIYPIGTVYGDEAFLSPEIGLEAAYSDYYDLVYYVCISAGEAFDPSEFTLTVHFTPHESWETEPNSEWDASKRYELDTQNYGVLYDNEDIDFFSFDLEERSHVYVSFRHPGNGSSEDYWMLSFSSMDVMYQLEPAVQIRGDQTETVIDLGVIPESVLYIQVNGAWVDDILQYDPSVYSISVHAEPTNTFPDVPSDTYYSDAVVWAINSHITEGTSRYTFSPNDLCSRSQIATFLKRTSDYPDVDEYDCVFTDVSPYSYHYYSIIWAYETGITKGTSETTFSPDDPCTRAQVVTFLWRLAGCPTANSSDHSFQDVSESAYYYQAMLWAVENGITIGTSESTFSPDQACTRAEVVTFLYRYAG